MVLIVKSLVLIVLAVGFTRLAASAWKKSKESLWVKLPLALLIEFVMFVCIYAVIAVYIANPWSPPVVDW